MRSDTSPNAINEHADKMATVSALRRLQRMVAQFKRQEALEDRVWKWTLRVPFVAATLALVIGLSVLLYCGWYWTLGAPKTFVVAPFYPPPPFAFTFAPLPATYLQYRDEVRALMVARAQANFFAPFQYRGLSGSAVVRAEIAPDGSLSGVMIMRSSGVPQIDAAACRVVRHAAPFPPFPEAMQAHKSMPLSSWISFAYGDLPADKLIPEYPATVERQACPEH